MKIVTVRIEDNSCKIDEVTNLENAKQEVIESTSDRIDELQKEGFLQILAYVKCAYEDYVGIVGKQTRINDVSWYVNRLDVSNTFGTIRICVKEEGAFIDFNYSGSLMKNNEPPRMKAKFKNNDIIVTRSTRQGICDLMNGWKDIKPEFQKEIDKAYKQKTTEIKSDISHLEYLLKVAEDFKA